MCVIIDTNRFGDAFSFPPKEAYRPLLDWILGDDRDGVAVIGGSKLAAEIGKHDTARRFFAQAVKAGRARVVPSAVVDAEQTRLEAAGSCASDDPHVIGLARVSGARTVCTEDRALMGDVTNKHLLDHPRGKVYRAAPHAHLLCHHVGCSRFAPQREAPRRR